MRSESMGLCAIQTGRRASVLKQTDRGKHEDYLTTSKLRVPRGSNCSRSRWGVTFELP